MPKLVLPRSPGDLVRRGLPGGEAPAPARVRHRRKGKSPAPRASVRSRRLRSSSGRRPTTWSGPGRPGRRSPYLDKFMKSKPDDAVLLQIRDRYGVGSVLRLDQYPETRSPGSPLSTLLASASLRNSTRPDRIQRYIKALIKTSEEQEYAVERLREAGPYAVPYLVQALDQANIPAGDRALLAYNMGRLDRSAVPPLIAVLDSADSRLVADAAHALGMIGDVRAVPPLTAVAASAPARDAARRAIEHLTGRSFESQSRSPCGS